MLLYLILLLTDIFSYRQHYRQGFSSLVGEDKVTHCNKLVLQVTYLHIPAGME